MLVKARATKEIFHRDDFYIIAFTPFTPYPSELQLSEYMNFTCKGALSWVTIGQDYEMDIDFVEANKYGVTYKINSVPSMQKKSFEDLSRAESFEILRKCTTSDTIANNILDVYPTFIHKILTEGKESIDVKKIKGVGDVYLACYERELTSKYKYFKILMDYSEFDLNVDDCKKLYSLYENDDNISKQFTEYPYNVLCVDLERSFGSVDKILKEKRKDLNKSVQRCTACIMDILNRNEYDGNTRILGNDMFVVMRDEYNVPELLDMVVDTCKESNYIFYDEKNKYIAKASTYGAECRVAQFVQDKLNNPIVWDIDVNRYKNVDGFEMTDEQLSTLDLLCKNNIVILNAPSGSGKTSSVKGIISMLEDNCKSYTLLAPTGSASLRLKSQTQRSASTIHRKALGDGEIDSDVIIIDEMSMVNLEVFILLLSVITYEDAKIVLVGDICQLEPIGCGKIFGDLIDSNKIPMAKLTKIFRYDTSGGAFVGTNIRLGKRFLNDERVKVKDNTYSICSNYKFIQCGDDEEEIFKNVLREYDKLSKKFGQDNVMILSPYNIGTVGTYAINEAIELEYNPPKPNEKIMDRKVPRYANKIVFRVGSRVVNTKNNYKAVSLDAWKQIEDSNGVLSKEDVCDSQVFNGEIGIVRDIDDEKMIIQFDEQLLVFTKSEINNLLLARCISAHRSQGGEWKAIINVVSPKHENMLSKLLLYVTDTRGKEYHVDIGDVKTFENALSVDNLNVRETFLKDLVV